jgi:hypothetical protein
VFVEAGDHRLAVVRTKSSLIEHLRDHTREGFGLEVATLFAKLVHIYAEFELLRDSLHISGQTSQAKENLVIGPENALEIGGNRLCLYTQPRIPCEQEF